MTYDAFFLPRHAAQNLRPYLTIFLRKTPKRRLPRGEHPDLRGFRHFFVYIAHFPRKSKLYGEIKWYFRHANSLNLGQVVNVAATTPGWG
jgi:hypothetical protein